MKPTDRTPRSATTDRTATKSKRVAMAEADAMGAVFLWNTDLANAIFF